MKRTYKGIVVKPFDVCWLDWHPPLTHASHGFSPRKVKVVKVTRGGRDIHVQDDKTNTIEIVHASRLSFLT